MIGQSKIAVVLPAFNAEKTLSQTVADLDRQLVDDIILVDDASRDETAQAANELGLHVYVHNRNRGYGGNQKSCYALAIQRGADIIVMVHPDYQYDPRLVPAMAGMIYSRVYDVVLGSRILGNGALAGGMPLVKFVANRFLTFTQNIIVGQKLSEYHTGYRAFSREVLITLPLEENSDDFIFDNQILCQSMALGFRIGEVSCPTKYFAEASSINFARSCVYGIGVIWTSLRYLMHRVGARHDRLFDPNARRLDVRGRTAETG